MARTFETLFKLNGKVDPSLQRALNQANSKTVRQAQATSKKVQSTFSGMAKKVAATFGAAFALSSAISLGKESIEEAQAAALANTKLTEIMHQRMGATDDQIKKIQDLAAAQQKLGVIEDDTQIAGAQQLATFLNQSSSLETLLPAMNNLAAQQKGVNATQEDLVNIGNMMGKVMQGQTGALRRVGVTFSKAEEKVLKYGDETERAAMLAQIITNNVGNMNAEVAKTDFGKFQQAKNLLGDMKETLGAQLMPLVGTFAQILLPLFKKGFTIIGKLLEKVAPLLTKLAEGLTPILEKLGEIVFKVFDALLPPLLELVGGILPILSAWLDAIMNILEPLLEPLTEIIKMLLPPLLKLMKALIPLWKTEAKILGAIAKVIGGALVEAVKLLMPLIEGLVSVFQGIIDFLVNIFSIDWERVWRSIASVFKGIWDGMVAVVKICINLIIGIINGLLTAWNATLGEVGDWIGVNIKIQPIAYLAEGATIRRPTLAMVGEGGDTETVVPHNNKARSRMLAAEAVAGTGMSLGNHVQVSYSPTINAAPGTDMKELQKVLESDFERFAEWWRRMQEGEGRLSFA